MLLLHTLLLGSRCPVIISLLLFAFVTAVNTMGLGVPIVLHVKLFMAIESLHETFQLNHFKVDVSVSAWLLCGTGKCCR